MSLARSNAVHMAIAFVAMGSWAVFANHGHPMPRPLVAGIAQGCVSAVITLFLKRMIEAIARRLDGLPALVLPPVAACLCSLALLVTIHRLAGTPEIPRTIAMPLTVTTIYAATYAFALRRGRNA